MKTTIIIVTLLFSATLFAQGYKPKSKENGNAKDKDAEIDMQRSTTRIFIDKALTTRVNKDWSVIAEFKSGIGETAQFFPVQIEDLKTHEKTSALEVDMEIKAPTGIPLVGSIRTSLTAWVGLDEIDEFIRFIEDNIIPNIKLKYKDKSSEFTFKAKELTLIFLIDEKRRRLTIRLNNYEPEGLIKSYDFWTETKVDNFPEVLEILKKVKSKELKF